MTMIRVDLVTYVSNENRGKHIIDQKVKPFISGPFKSQEEADLFEPEYGELRGYRIKEIETEVLEFPWKASTIGTNIEADVFFMG